MRHLTTGLLVALLLAAPVGADAPAKIPVTLKDHRFSPSEITVQAGTPTVLVGAERVESHW